MKSDISKADRIQEALNFPSVILIDNCNACNLQCSMCDHVNIKKYKKIQLMDMGLYVKIIDEIALENPDARVWEIFFGDPFMCGDIAKRIEYAKDKGLTDVVLNSNGCLMNKKKAYSVIKAGLDAMYVGIDAFSPEIYSKIRIGGDFEKTVKNVQEYRDLLYNCGNSKQKLFVQFVVTDINEHEQEAFKEFWKSEGVDTKIRPKVSWAGLVDAENLIDNRQVTRKPCYWLMRTLNICADGNIAFCSVDIHCRVNCGNVTRESIKSIWNNRLAQYREMHRTGRFDQLPEMCRNCSDWQSAYAEYATNRVPK